MLKTIYGRPATQYLQEYFPDIQLVKSDRFHKLNPKLNFQDYSVKDIDQSDKFLLTKQILERDPQDRVLIFCKEGETTDKLAKFLSSEGILADCLHSKQSENERADKIYSFQQNKIVCLVCTDLAARGIDFKDVKLVLQFDYAENALNLLHRIGRTGRMGTGGKGREGITQ